jgi:acyl dehydratase
VIRAEPLPAPHGAGSLTGSADDGRRRTTTYRKGLPVRRFDRPAALQGAVGEVLGTTAWQTITAERIAAFAAVSGDRQWIHTDPERAEDGPYGALIAQGYLTLSLLPSFAAEVFELAGVTRVVAYGVDRARFVRPVRAGSRLRSTVRLTRFKAVDGGFQVNLTHTLGVEVDGRELPACVAEVVTRLYL